MRWAAAIVQECVRRGERTYEGLQRDALGDGPEQAAYGALFLNVTAATAVAVAGGRR
jgi:hypothetical protein